MRTWTVECHTRGVALLEVLEAHASLVAGLLDAAQTTTECLDVTAAEEGVGNAWVSVLWRPRHSHEVVVWCGACREEAGIRDLYRVRKDIDHHAAVTLMLFVTEGIDDRLADGLTWNLRDLLACRAAVNHDAATDIGVDVVFRLVDKLKHRGVFLLKIKDVDAIVTGEHPHGQTFVGG